MFKKLIVLVSMYINARLDNDIATANVLARFIDIELEETVTHNKAI